MLGRWMAGVAAGLAVAAACAAFAQEGGDKAPKRRLFELRTYVANPGKIEALHARFRDHTRKLFARHGMDVIGFWTPTEGDNADRTVTYLLAYPSREARDASWKAFRADPDWIRAKAESEKDGVLVEKATETFLTPTDYSPIQ